MVINMALICRYLLEFNGWLWIYNNFKYSLFTHGKWFIIHKNVQVAQMNKKRKNISRNTLLFKNWSLASRKPGYPVVERTTAKEFNFFYLSLDHQYRFQRPDTNANFFFKVEFIFKITFFPKSKNKVAEIRGESLKEEGGKSEPPIIILR